MVKLTVFTITTTNEAMVDMVPYAEVKLKTEETADTYDSVVEALEIGRTNPKVDWVDQFILDSDGLHYRIRYIREETV